MKKNEIKWLENHGMTEPPVCKHCGDEVKFRGPKYGYSLFCSVQCLNSSSYRKEKTKQTCQEKYGTDNPSQSSTIKQKIKETTKQRYGVDNPMQIDDVKMRIKSTLRARYGVDNIFAHPDTIKRIKRKQIELYGGMGNGSDITRQKIEATNIQRYGVNGYNNRNAYKETLMQKYGDPNYVNIDQIKQTNLSKYGCENVSQIKLVEEMNERGIISLHGSDWVCKCTNTNCNLCEERQFTINGDLWRARFKAGIELCTILNPVSPHESWAEKEVKMFVESLGFVVERNRTILNGQELDIYIPEKKIAIEYNGCYWHSSEFKTRKYHFDKFNKCLAQGIQLITIWEDQWIHKREICKHIIASKLGVYKERVFARKCKVTQLSSKEANEFIKAHHIQGSTQGPIRYGLKYNDKLLCVMTFGKKRSSMMGTAEKTCGEYELVRFCGLPDVQVIGGASKLFKHFLNEHPDVKIVKSYSSNDISTGNLYKMLNFKCTNIGYGSYWYIEKTNMLRYHRYNFRKANLKDMGYDTANLTESQIMSKLPYYKIFDTGMMTWTYTKKENP